MEKTEDRFSGMIREWIDFLGKATPHYQTGLPMLDYQTRLQLRQFVMDCAYSKEIRESLMDDRLFGSYRRWRIVKACGMIGGFLIWVAFTLATMHYGFSRILFFLSAS